MTTTSKRILFISPQPFFQWRGSPIRVAFDTQALSELGYEVDLLTLPIGEDRDIPGVRIIRVANPFGVKNIPIGPSLWKLFFDVLLTFRARKLIKENKYAAIHAIEDAGAFSVFLARMAKVPLVFEKHSDPGSYKKGFFRNMVMFAYSKVEAFTLDRASAMIGTGPGLIEQARDVAPHTPGHHIFDIPSSLVEAEEEAVTTARNSLMAQPDEVLITYVGSFAVYQGIDLMFSSIPLVVREHPKARFVVIGGTEEEISERKAILSREGVEQHVTFTGKIPPDQLPHYLGASDILLSPRIAGTNTPLKILDYFKAGGAIVATDTEANRLILDETNAALAPPEPADYARAIGELVADPERRKKLGEQGRSLTADRYNFAEFKRRIGVCYEGIFTP